MVRVKRLYEVFVPPKREYMHLDTVFTIVAPPDDLRHKRGFMESRKPRLVRSCRQ